MNVLRYIKRIKRMDNLIRRKATGCPDEFAKRLNISRSTLMEYIKLLKELNAPIEYDHVSMTYYYLYPCNLKLGFENKLLQHNELLSLNKKELANFCEVVLDEK